MRFLTSWYRGLDAQSRWYVLIALGFGLGFIVPASWAFNETRSLNEAVAVLQVRPPLELLASSLPSAGLVVFAAILGAAIAVLPPAAMLRKGQSLFSLSLRTRWVVVGFAVLSAVLVGPTVAIGALLVPALAGASWPLGAVVGSFAGGSAVLLAISTGEQPGARGPRSKFWDIAEYAGVLLGITSVFLLGWALSPAPSIAIEDSSGVSHVGLLLEAASEGVWMIEQPEDDSESGTVVLIDANLATLKVATR